MRVTSLELAGEPTRDGGMPRAFARIGRRLGSETIEVTIVLPGGEQTHTAAADSEGELWAMAQRLQEHLDGGRGTNSEINEYLRELQRFAD